MLANAIKIDEKTYKGMFRCQGKKFSVYQSYDLNGENIINPFYFTPYYNKIYLILKFELIY